MRAREKSLTLLMLLGAGCAHVPYAVYTSSYKPGSEDMPIASLRDSASIIQESEMQSVQLGFYDKNVLDDWTEGEIEAIQELTKQPFEIVQAQIHTPRQVAIYLARCSEHGGKEFDTITFGREYWMSGRLFHILGRVGDCDDGMMAAASLLKDDGFPPQGLFLHGKTRITGPRGTYLREEEFYHAIYIYVTKDQKYGSLGLNQCDLQAPLYNSIDELICGLSRASGDEIMDYWIMDIGKARPDFDVNWVSNRPFK